MHLIRKYFNDQKWTVDDLKQTQWSKVTNYDMYNLGKQKNKRGRCINSNGVGINANAGDVIIAYFDQYGNETRPRIRITKDSFKIIE